MIAHPGYYHSPEENRRRIKVRKALEKYFRAKGVTNPWKIKELILRWIRQKGWREPVINQR